MTGPSNGTRQLASLFGSRTGIDLGRGSQGPSLERLVLQRTRELGLASVDAYLEALARGESPELIRLINATTIGLSWLFRDAEQLAAIGQLFAARGVEDRPLEIWVPGCARGEDVYSLAMIASTFGRPVSILGTDINSDFLAEAERGVYSAWSCRHIPARLAALVESRGEGRRCVAASLRRSVRFARHNLLELPPLPERARGWDLVLCRNVLIYFYAGHAAATVARLGEALGEEGWLFLGANETCSPPSSLRPVSVGGRIGLRRAVTTQPARPAAFEPLPPLPRPETEPEPQHEQSAPEAIAPTSASPLVDELLGSAADRHVEGRFAEALTLYAQALAIAPLLNEAHMLLGVTHHMMGDHGAAVQALRAALFLDPDLWPAAFYLALSHDKLGNRVEATRAYRHVVEAADKPHTFSTVVLEQLGVWKRDIVHLARQRGGRAP